MNRISNENHDQSSTVKSQDNKRALLDNSGRLEDCYLYYTPMVPQLPLRYVWSSSRDYLEPATHTQTIMDPTLDKTVRGMRREIRVGRMERLRGDETLWRIISWGGEEGGKMDGSIVQGGVEALAYAPLDSTAGAGSHVLNMP